MSAQESDVLLAGGPENAIANHSVGGYEEEDDGGEHEKGTVAGTTFNSITNVIGGGVLNMPHAMYQASLGIGIFLCVLSSILSAYSVYLLVRVCDRVHKYTIAEVWAFGLFPQASIADISDATMRRDSGKLNAAELEEVNEFLAKQERNAVWRERMILFMTIAVILFNYGCLVLYGVVIADSLPPVVEHFFHGTGIWIEKSTWLLFAGVVFFFLSCARKMDELKWSSLLGFVTIFYIVVIIVVKFFVTRSDESDYGSASHGPADSYFKVSLGVADAMTTIGLAFAYHYNVPNFYKEMHRRNAKKFLTTAAISQPVIFFSYLMTGLFGYMLFGEAVNSKHSGGNVVKNFSDDDVVVNIGRFGLFFHFCCVYPILAVACRRGLHATYVRYTTRPAAKSAPEASLQSAISDERGACNNPHVDISMFATRAYSSDASLLVVACEAFGIVSTSIVLAWIAPGINLVVNITGCLFGILFMFIVPGILGAKMFHELLGSGAAGPSDRRHYYCSLFVAGFGIFFMVASFVGIIKDMIDGNN